MAPYKIIDICREPVLFYGRYYSRIEGLVDSVIYSSDRRFWAAIRHIHYFGFR